MKTLALLALLAAQPSAPAPVSPQLSVVFQPLVGKPGPVLVVHLEERPGGHQAARVALLLGDQPRWIEAVEARPAQPGAMMPVGPERVSLRSAADGALLLTIHGLPEWQAGLEDARRGGVRGEGVLVAEPDTLRLTVAAPEVDCAGAGCGWSAAARAVGTRAAVEGVAWVRRGPPEGVVVSDGEAAWPSELAVLARRPACAGRAVDAAVHLGEEADLRLWADATPALCRGWTVSRLEGERVDLRARKRPVRALVVR